MLSNVCKGTVFCICIFNWIEKTDWHKQPSSQGRLQKINRILPLGTTATSENHTICVFLCDLCGILECVARAIFWWPWHCLVLWGHSAHYQAKLRQRFEPLYKIIFSMTHCQGLCQDYVTMCKHARMIFVLQPVEHEKTNLGAISSILLFRPQLWGLCLKGQGH